MTKEIYLAGGCFWGVEKYFRNLEGVINTQVGYANGKTENPTYQDVSYKNTQHKETVQIFYNSEIIPLDILLEYYYKIIDPTSKNKQGNDRGPQYKTGIYYIYKEDKNIILNSIEKLQKNYSNKIQIEVEPLIHFYKAEEEHQKYLDKNPNSYCHIKKDLLAYKKVYKRKTQEELKRVLTDTQYKVTIENKTEDPYNNAYDQHFEKGIYVDITTGQPLFSSSDKYDAGCGWPSFTKPIEKDNIVKKEDSSHHMKRIEVRSKIGDAHLGHVFKDGPFLKGGNRYCINSASLRFIKKENMEKEGYKEYLKYIQ